MEINSEVYMLRKRFKVALSFPGEYREFVSQVANWLAKNLGQQAVFYDQWFQAELARPNLDDYLQAIYHDHSELIVPFLCTDYAKREWCGLEWRAIRDLLKRRQDQDIMPMRFDNTHIPGLFGIDGYIDLKNHNPERVANLILQRLQHNNTSDGSPIDKVEVAPQSSSFFSIELDRLNILRKKVKAIVEEKLASTRDKMGLIPIGKTRCEGAIDNPIDRIADRSGKIKERLPSGQSMIDFFDEVHKSLLIIGEPGAGKTTTLLELAHDLIVQSDTKSVAVPVVVNLSSWNESYGTLLAWLTNAMADVYQMPEKDCETWIKTMRLLPLLDGLDEVNPDQRISCVQAINQFVKDYGGLTGMAVGSRCREYEAIGIKLRLHGAVRLEPLTTTQIDIHLAGMGPTLSGLHTAWSNDPIWQTMTTSPLMLNIMSRACVNIGVETLASYSTGGVELLHKRLFDTYIERLFEHRPYTDHLYTKEQTLGWLTSIAQKMLKHSQSEFLIGRLQPSWLANKIQVILYTLTTRLLVPFIMLIVLCILPSSWLFQSSPFLK